MVNSQALKAGFDAKKKIESSATTFAACNVESKSKMKVRPSWLQRREKGRSFKTSERSSLVETKGEHCTW